MHPAMRIKKKTPYSSSDLRPKEIHLKVPAAWEELNDEDLHIAYNMTINSRLVDVAKVVFFMNRNGLQLRPLSDGNPEGLFSRNGRRLPMTAADFALVLEELSWMEEEPRFPSPRLIAYGHGSHIDPLLHDVPFFDYLKIENLWQGYLRSQDKEALLSIAHIIYRDKEIWRKDERMEEEGMVYGVAVWCKHLHEFFFSKWSDLFRTSPNPDAPAPDLEEVMNAEIRALTGGDITKEAQILSSDTWRALTELNEKAREARELNERMNK